MNYKKRMYKKRTYWKQNYKKKNWSATWPVDTSFFSCIPILSHGHMTGWHFFLLLCTYPVTWPRDRITLLSSLVYLSCHMAIWQDNTSVFSCVPILSHGHMIGWHFCLLLWPYPVTWPHDRITLLSSLVVLSCHMVICPDDPVVCRFCPSCLPCVQSWRVCFWTVLPLAGGSPSPTEHSTSPK